jgi:predicted ABC-type ATPase
MPKRILMIAGPNGAGKTTAASNLVPDLTVLYEYINADEIARGLAPLNPESVALEASKLMVKRLQGLLKANKSFAFETTASGTNYLKYLKEAKDKGYEISLMFLWLPSPEQAMKRVIQRVMQGGHSIPEETIKRRYYAGIKNLLKYYLPIADIALILDNSMEKGARVIASKNTEYSLKVEDMAVWQKLEELGHGQDR